jgi:hypothetical protein
VANADWKRRNVVVVEVYAEKLNVIWSGNQCRRRLVFGVNHTPTPIDFYPIL